MRKGCRNNYIEAFGAVYWVKKLFQKILGVATTPSLRRTRVKRHYILYYMCTHCVYQTKDCVLKMVIYFCTSSYCILWGQQMRVKFNVRWTLTNITIIKILWLSFKLQNISKAITLLVRHDVEAQCAYLIRFDNPFFYDNIGARYTKRRSRSKRILTGLLKSRLHLHGKSQI